MYNLIQLRSDMRTAGLRNRQLKQDIKDNSRAGMSNWKTHADLRKNKLLCTAMYQLRASMRGLNHIDLAQQPVAYQTALNKALGDLKNLYWIEPQVVAVG